MDNYFQELYSRNVNDHVETKGKFKYLSWTYAVAELSKLDPQASWEVMRFNGLPFLSTECGYFVEVAVTVKGITRSQIHPVLDNNNRPIPQPNAFQINTSIQRCLVKAIALHGLGLYIYSGEDLPEQPQLSDEEIAHQKAEIMDGFIKRIESATEKIQLDAIWLEMSDEYKNALLPKFKEKSKSLQQMKAAA